ncbi:MAG: UDP-N-acetylglucosamine 4,6-dehydratase [Bacillaceae bacterium G1]|nr:UDP-N-acetylglucosamine 4,6-dehydratase [Bacillota bacterium]OJF16297.1 MAG: UDP-N-acetylglucosamine 4,6-dehydratase [Bacillaceae bacterium G1]
MFEGRFILITGGTGSWGTALTRMLLAKGAREIRIFSRNEFAQVQMQRAFDHHPALRFLIGDVRDDKAVFDACAGVELVFHLAALKHVPICEGQPTEAMKTNIVGTENVIRACLAHGVEKMIDVSTDKAVDPINVYGLTKAMAERLTIQANRESPKTRFVCIRGGNVLGTNGSVVPFFRECILAGKPIPVTSKKMTRFFLTLQEAITLLLKAAEVSIGGETFVMKMNACNIYDLAVVMREHLATKPVPIRIVGMRPGEKLHEVLISRHESTRTYCYDDQYYVILPPNPDPILRQRYGALPPVPFREYTSRSTKMTRKEIADMLKRGGYLS